jgi:hypothetical protein
MPAAVITGTAVVGVSGRVNMSIAVVRPPVDVAAVISGIIRWIVSSVICGITAVVPIPILLRWNPNILNRGLSRQSG